MANAPDRYERFMVDGSELKVDFEKDTRLPHAGTFVILREDHTLGNLMRTQLHKDADVTFAGYRIPHPLEHRLLVKLSTNGSKSPIVATKEAVTALKFQVGGLLQQFSKETARMSSQR
jgi:DNA-directed RNA polymerase II subunit RPB11